MIQLIASLIQNLFQGKVNKTVVAKKNEKQTKRQNGTDHMMLPKK